jgi:hypothetical protein
MKKFTIIFAALMVTAFAGLVGYLIWGPDFTEPAKKAAADEDPDAPVWDLKMDDLLDYLEEKGMWDRADMLPISEGVANEAFVWENAEVYWWDLENASEDSPEYRAYMDMLEEGQIDLYGKGLWFMPVTKNGPFGLFSPYYTGDITALEEAFKAFGH